MSVIIFFTATLEELYTERTGPQTHSDRVHSTQFLINF